MIDWLKNVKSQDLMGNEEISYSFNDLKANFEIEQLDKQGILVLNWDRDRFLLHFCVLEWYCSDPDDSNTFYSPIFHGVGPVGSLRECRHTHWGEDGYVFYPNGPVIYSAFKALSKYYDDLISTGPKPE